MWFNAARAFDASISALAQLALSLYATNWGLEMAAIIPTIAIVVMMVAA